MRFVDFNTKTRYNESVNNRNMILSICNYKHILFSTLIKEVIFHE